MRHIKSSKQKKTLIIGYKNPYEFATVKIFRRLGNTAPNDSSFSRLGDRKKCKQTQIKSYEN